MRKIFLAFSLSAGLLSFPAFAEEAAVEATDLAAPGAEAPVAEPAPEEAALSDGMVTVTPVDVWWGNRSISYGNYIKFNKVDAKCAGPAQDDCICPGCVGADCPPPCDDAGPWDKIFFDLDKSVLRPAGIVECEKILAYLNANPTKGVFIEGHTCDLAPDDYNIGLGQRRANAVREWLVSRGVDPARIQTRTFGETTPWVGLEQRDLNRRAIVTATP